MLSLLLPLQHHQTNTQNSSPFDLQAEKPDSHTCDCDLTVPRIHSPSYALTYHLQIPPSCNLCPHLTNPKQTNTHFQAITHIHTSVSPSIHLLSYLSQTKKTKTCHAYLRVSSSFSLTPYLNNTPGKIFLSLLPLLFLPFFFLSFLPSFFIHPSIPSPKYPPPHHPNSLYPSLPKSIPSLSPFPLPLLSFLPFDKLRNINKIF